MFKFSVRTWWDPEAARQKLLREAAANVRMLAEYVAFKARAYCPVDTGELRNSIHIISSADGMTFHVYASAKHAEPVEFGHVMRNGRFHPPNPFLRRAVNDGAREFPHLIGDSRVRQGFHQGALMGATFRAQ